MNRCPITYEPCGAEKYSKKGLHLLSRKLSILNDFPFTPKEQIQLAMELSAKISIQGVQPKLSVILNVADQRFENVEKGGTFILKPPHLMYDELPQNEDVTMKLAALVDIETPLHGLSYNIDGSLSYFIKRFDRLPKNKKIATEDFSQLLGCSRETKYESSMEKVIFVLERHCTFPLLEKLKLFRLTIFNFLIGNEDMHLKNFSLIRRENKVELSPAYDLINTFIVLKTEEELALPLRGKKSRFSYEDFVTYFAKMRLRLPNAVVEQELLRFEKMLPSWKQLLEISFLSERRKKLYTSLIDSRWLRLHK